MGASSTEFDAEYGADQIQILEGLDFRIYIPSYIHK